MLAGEENLIPMSERTKEEQREIARKGGIASGKARQEKAMFKKFANMLLSIPVKDHADIDNMLGTLGIEDENKTTTAGIMAVAREQALNGDNNARNFLFEASGEKKTDIDLNGGLTINFNGESEIDD